MLASRFNHKPTARSTWAPPNGRHPTHAVSTFVIYQLSPRLLSITVDKRNRTNSRRDSRNRRHPTNCSGERSPSFCRIAAKGGDVRFANSQVSTVRDGALILTGKRVGDSLYRLHSRHCRHCPSNHTRRTTTFGHHVTPGIHSSAPEFHPGVARATCPPKLPDDHQNGTQRRNYRPYPATRHPNFSRTMSPVRRRKVEVLHLQSQLSTQIH